MPKRAQNAAVYAAGAAPAPDGGAPRADGLGRKIVASAGGKTVASLLRHHRGRHDAALLNHEGEGEPGERYGNVGEDVAAGQPAEHMCVLEESAASACP